MKKNQLLLYLMVISISQSPCIAMEPNDSSDLSDDILRHFVAATVQLILPADFGSESSIYQYTLAAYSHDSKILAAVGNNGTDCNTLRVDIWKTDNDNIANVPNINSFQLKGIIPQPANTSPNMPKIIAESALAFSNKGLLLAAGQPDKTIAIFDLSSTQPIQPTILPNSLLSSALAYTPDDSKLIIGSTDTESSVALWDVEKKELINTIFTTESRVNTIACTPNGSIFATGFENGAITLWNLKSCKPLTTFTNHNVAVKTLAFNDDGSECAVGFADGTLELINMQTSNTHTLVPPQPVDMIDKIKQLAAAVIALRYNPTKPELISISGQPTVKIWNLPTKTCDTSIDFFDNTSYRATISPDCTMFTLVSFWKQDETDAYNLDLARKLVNRQLTPEQMMVLKKLATPQLIAQLKNDNDCYGPDLKFKSLGYDIIDTFSTLPETDQQTLKAMGFKFDRDLNQ